MSRHSRLSSINDKQGILKSVDGTKPMDEVFSAIVGILGE